MATLSFEGETHNEIVQKVRRWLASIEGMDEAHLSPAEAITAGAELTKDALRVIASSAPSPVAQSDVVKALTEMGYKATDATRNALVESLDSLATVTGGSLLKRMRDASRNAMWEMNATVAKQVLKGLTGV